MMIFAGDRNKTRPNQYHERRKTKDRSEVIDSLRPRWDNPSLAIEGTGRVNISGIRTNKIE